MSEAHLNEVEQGLKVKKFRLKPRFPTVGRILKSMMKVKQLPHGVEDSIPRENELFIKHLGPVGFYQTWHGDKIPLSYKEKLKDMRLSRAVAISAVAATIGPEPEEQISEMLMSGETIRSQVFSALGEESADLAFNFIYKLLGEDAKTDDCGVSDPIKLDDDVLLSETLELLRADQEGIDLDTASHLSPRFTRVALVAWTPLSRRKKASQAIKKKFR